MSNSDHHDEFKRALGALGRIDGEAAANRAVERCAEDSSIIFLTRSEYDDLLARKGLPELKRYKMKEIIVVSDKI